MTDDVAIDLDLAILAAREAGAVIMKSFRTEQEVTLKSPDQPLTQADLAADATLKRILLGNRPDYGWLSEETADNRERLKRRFVWIVDPIDGTRSYIAGYPEFAVSIGLAENERALLGVVYNPASDEMYAARRGGGAWRVGGGALNVQRSGARSLVASRSEIRQGELEPFAKSFEITGTGSTAYKMMKVAAGSAQVFVSRGPKSEWDVCAGALIVEEAGGRATDLKGRELWYNQQRTDIYGILATNGVLHSELLDRVASLPEAERLAGWRSDETES
ncbi:MAG TPA: 3'(2'),5'-bisphosphate nucleotidase CysQ [Longimicrobiales bacterium]